MNYPEIYPRFGLMVGVHPERMTYTEAKKAVTASSLWFALFPLARDRQAARVEASK